MKKRILAALAPLALLFAFAAPAQAVTYEYCNWSLAGGGSLAPDNDHEYARRSIGNAIGVGLHYTGNPAGIVNGGWLVQYYRYLAGPAGNVRAWASFQCWENPGYHDAWVNWGRA